jgi:hypothetical protein
VLCCAVLCCAVLCCAVPQVAQTETIPASPAVPKMCGYSPCPPFAIHDLSGTEFEFNSISIVRHGLSNIDYFIAAPHAAVTEGAYAELHMPEDRVIVYSGSSNPETGSCPYPNPKYFTMPEFGIVNKVYFIRNKDDNSTGDYIDFLAVEKNCKTSAKRIVVVTAIPKKHGFEVKQHIIEEGK